MATLRPWNDGYSLGYGPIVADSNLKVSQPQIGVARLTKRPPTGVAKRVS